MFKEFILLGALFSLSLIETAGKPVYRKLTIEEFDEFDYEDTENLNRYRKKKGLSLLTYDSDLIDLAQIESDRMASAKTFLKPNLNSLELNVLAYTIKYTGKMESNSELLGRYACFDNFLNVTYAKSYDLDENCSGYNHEKFVRYGFGRALDSGSNLYVVRLFGNKKNAIESLRIINESKKKEMKSDKNEQFNQTIIL